MGVTGWDWVIIVTYPVDVVPFTSRSANEPVHNILLKLSSANRHQDINSCEILTVHKCGERLFHRDVAIIRGLIIQYLVAQLVYCRQNRIIAGLAEVFASLRPVRPKIMEEMNIFVPDDDDDDD